MCKCELCGAEKLDVLMKEFIDNNGVVHHVCRECARASKLFICPRCHEGYFNMAAVERDGDRAWQYRIENQVIIDRFNNLGIELTNYHGWHTNININYEGQYTYDMCKSCWDEIQADYVQCEDCGTYFHIDDIITDRDGTLLCESCYDMREDERSRSDDWDHSEIHSYGDKLPVRQAEIGKKRLIGFEFEFLCKDSPRLETWDEQDEFLKELLAAPSVTARISEDSSVDYEVVTYPTGAKEAKKNILAIADVLKKYRCRSWDGEQCGIHFHVNRGGLYHLDNILYFFKNNQEALKKLSGRTQSQISRWCNFDFDIQKPFYGGSRYRAINCSNRHTIEFRLFRGTLNKDRLSGYVDFLETILRYSKYLKKLNWNEVIHLTGNKFLGGMFEVDMSRKYSVKEILNNRGVLACA